MCSVVKAFLVYLSHPDDATGSACKQLNDSGLIDWYWGFQDGTRVFTTFVNDFQLCEEISVLLWHPGEH